MISSHIKKTVCSFDVFDTCISRRYQNPRDLFYDLGLAISPKEMSHDDKYKFSKIFMLARIDAEKKAHRINGKLRGCKFDEIYSLLDLSTKCTYSKKEIMNLELQLEKECIYVVQSTKSIIDKFRDNNHRIIFISDMYLEKEFIKNLLMHHGLFKSGDELFVSSELLLTKRSGDLFKHVLKTLDIQPFQLHHYGDNPISDVKSPKNIGIHTHLINTTKILNHEKIIHASDNPLIRRLNTLGRNVRVQLDNELNSYAIDTFSRMMPSIVGFCTWIIDQATTRKLNTLYFVTRDGELPFEICKILLNGRSDIKPTLLYGSRKAWLLASIDNMDNFNWLKIATENQPSSIKDAFERLGLNDTELNNVYKLTNLNLKEFNSVLPINECENLIKLLFKNKSLLSLIENIAKNKRLSIINYLDQEGLFKHKQWAIVDSGWELNLQKFLQNIMNKKHPDSSVTGLYFSLANNCLTHNACGPAFCFHENRHYIPLRRNIIENCLLSSNIGSTSGYELENEKYTPILEHSKVQSRLLLNEGRAYALLYTQELLNISTSKKNIAIFQKYSKQLLTDTLRNPPKTVLEYLSKVRLHRDIRQNITPTDHLILEMKLNDIIEIIFGYIGVCPAPLHYWPEASANTSKNIFKYSIKFLLSLKFFSLKMKKKLPSDNIQ